MNNEHDPFYERGKTLWVKRFKNAAGTNIPRHSTGCRNRQKAYKYFESLNLLESWAGRKKAKQAAEPKQGMPLPEALEVWLAEAKEGQLRDTTRAQWRYVVTSQFIKPMAAQGLTRLGEPKTPHCRALQADWFKRGKKLNTILDYRRPISTMYDWLIKHKELEDVKNPWLPIAMPTEIAPTFEQLLERRPSDNGIATLPLDLDGDVNWQAVRKNLVPFLQSREYKMNPLAMRPETFLALVELLYLTGLRRGDAVTFRPDVIEWNGDVSYSTLQKKTGGNVTVGLPPELAHKLRSLPLLPWRGRSNYPTAGLYPFWDGSKPTFKRYMDDNLGTPLRELGAALNIPGGNLRPHRFRDSFAVNMLNRGLSMKEVSLLLGHKSVQVTEQYYSPEVLSRVKFLLARQAAVRLVA